MSDYPSRTLTLSLLSVANIAVLVKSRLHELQDIREQRDQPHYESVLFNDYRCALDAINAQLPDDMQQRWMRS